MLAVTAARHLTRTLARLGERGATSAEYALLGALIAVVISGAVALFGQAVLGLFGGITAAL